MEYAARRRDARATYEGDDFDKDWPIISARMTSGGQTCDAWAADG